MEPDTDSEISRAMAAIGAPALKYRRFGYGSIRGPMPVQPAPAGRVAGRGAPAAEDDASQLSPRGGAGGSHAFEGRPTAASMFPLLGSALAEAADVGI